jgi:hypothetical protein
MNEATDGGPMAAELILRRECPVCETDEATAADVVQEGESVTCQACRAPLVAVDGVDMTLEVQEDLMSAAYRRLYGDVEHLRSQMADVARWLGCGPTVGEVEAHCKALRPVEYRPGLPAAAGATSMHSLAADGHCTHCLLPAALISTSYGCMPPMLSLPDTSYRPGLPTVEQVRAHERRGGVWQMRRDWGGWPTWASLRVTGDRVEVRWDSVWGCPTGTEWLCRPVLMPDGTPCQWPDSARSAR